MNKVLIYTGLLILFITLVRCSATRTASGYGNVFAGRYAADLTEGETEMVTNYQNMISQKGDRYISRLYFPETKTLIRYAEFSDRGRTIQDGPFREYYDEGQIQQEGQYTAGQQTGQWTSYYKTGEVSQKSTYVNGEENGASTSFHKNGKISQEGNYLNGSRVGEWRSYYPNGELQAQSIYVSGALDGRKLRYDSTGQQLETRYYQAGQLVDENGNPIEQINGLETMPSFPGCEEVKDPKEYRKCSDRRMLEFIYGNVRYPASARENGIQGTALIRFVIEKDGSINELESIHGVSRDIRAEVFRIIEMMPKWNPGMVDGEPVRVQFNLPVKFKLE